MSEYKCHSGWADRKRTYKKMRTLAKKYGRDRPLHLIPTQWLLEVMNDHGGCIKWTPEAIRFYQNLKLHRR